MRVAFVSTPSLFFSLGAAERKGCAVLDFDKQVASSKMGCAVGSCYRSAAR